MSNMSREALAAIIELAADKAADKAVEKHMAACHIAVRFPPVETAVFGNGSSGLKADVQDLKRDVSDMKATKEKGRDWTLGIVAVVLSSILTTVIMKLMEG